MHRLAPVVVSVVLLLLAMARVPAPSASSPVDPLHVVAELGMVRVISFTIQNPAPVFTTAFLFEAQASLPPVPARHEAPWRVPLPDQPGPIAPALRQALADSPSGEAELLVFLAEQAELQAAVQLPDWDARGQAVFETLTAHAARTQRPLLARLRARGVQAESFWIVSALRLRGDQALADWLARQPEVALLTADARHPLEPVQGRPVLTDTVAWGVERIGAPTVWAQWGVRGEGIVVATMDSGAEVSHPALRASYRGWQGGSLRHDYNWADVAVRPAAPAPTDDSGHGTHVLGTIAAAPLSPTVGVAPGVRWIAVRACDFVCLESELIAAAQWLLAPTDRAGQLPRPDLRPHIINNSWGSGQQGWYAGFVTAWRAAGIFAPFAAGNLGPSCGTALAPASDGGALAVGATDAEEQIAPFSARGPSRAGHVKPDLVAPGVDILSTAPGGDFVLGSGTSMAAPHVAGAVALLWSANPSLVGDLSATEALLRESSLPRPSAECSAGAATVPNNVYGSGRLDVAAAVAAGRVDLPWLDVPPSVALPASGQAVVSLSFDARRVVGPGVYLARLLVRRGGSIYEQPVTFEVQPGPATALLEGRLTDAWQGTGVQGEVRVESGPTLRADGGGHFSATLPLGTYPLLVEARGYFPLTTSIVLSEAHTLTVGLRPDLPRLLLWPPDPPALHADLAFGEERDFWLELINAGSQPLAVRAEVPAEEWTIAESREAALYDTRRLPILPLTNGMVLTEPLTLGFSIPMYGGSTGRLYVSDNGWVSGVEQENDLLQPTCLPGGFLGEMTLAPFWAELDPSQGGAVRAGHVARDTFVVSYERVPLWASVVTPTTPTYTFQVALHADGHVEFLYGAMGPMPPRWAAGMATSVQRGQSIACHESPQPLAGRGWRALAQPLPRLWLAAAPDELVLGAGARQRLRVRLRGLAPAPWRDEPYRARLQLRSNDPSRPLVTLPVSATIEEAPYHTGLPLVATP